MGLTWPAALLGLVVAGIPLLIHLLQRGEYRRVDVATTRFLVDQQKLRWRRLKISQPWLLALRLLLVILCVLLLAEPYRRGTGDTRETGGWTLVSPRVSADSARELAPPDSELRWLAPGFASLATDPPAWQAGATWSLLTDADTELAPGRALRVIAPGDSAGLSASRPALSRSVTWLTAPSTLPGRAGGSDNGIDVDIVAADARRADAARVAAALAAWQFAGLNVTYRVVPDTAATLRARHTIWLSERPIPLTDTDDPRVVLTDRRPPAAEAQVVSFNSTARPEVFERRAGAVTIRTRVGGLGGDDGDAREDNFARRLLWQLLGRELWQPPQDYPVSDAQRQPRVVEQATVARTAKWPLSTSLILLVLGTALAERLVSTLRKRERHES